MELVGWSVIVPLSIASLLTGVLQSLDTVWGLLRHYWVVAKLLITVLATLLLLVHMQPVVHLADAAARATLAGGELEGMRNQLIADAAAALLALLTAAALSVFKPRGITELRSPPPTRAEPPAALNLYPQPAGRSPDIRQMAPAVQTRPGVPAKGAARACACWVRGQW
ncbi:hypothetical protein ACFYO5_24075 [Streptomyces sp. NPDC006259]|uniref:hypothetical protein n=1 Tax=Streptomyces sp. NPDC006259 TaxID=3364740 RepID=UPI0036A776A1